MLKKAIKYVDYNDVERNEEFYFNLSQAEIVEMEMSTAGGLVEKIQAMTAKMDGEKIITFFKEIVLKAYGVKSPDGKRFIKSQELRDEFSQTEAYTVLFMELATNADAAAAFINAILPKTLSQK